MYASHLLSFVPCCPVARLPPTFIRSVVSRCTPPTYFPSFRGCRLPTYSPSFRGITLYASHLLSFVPWCPGVRLPPIILRSVVSCCTPHTFSPAFRGVPLYASRPTLLRSVVSPCTPPTYFPSVHGVPFYAFHLLSFVPWCPGVRFPLTFLRSVLSRCTPPT